MSKKRRPKQEKLYEASGEHLFIRPEVIERIPVERKPVSSRKPRRGWPAGKPLGQLKEQALKVLKLSTIKNKVIPDTYVYFVMSLSSSFGSPKVVNFLERSGLVPVEFSGDRTAKVRIPRGDYQRFLASLEDFQPYVQEIRESSLSEKVDEELLQAIERNPQSSVQVDIEISQRSGSNYKEEILRQLESYLHSRNLSMEPTYTSEGFFLLSAELPGSTVKEIAENLDAISKIHLAHPFHLQTSTVPSRGTKSKRLKLSSLDLKSVPGSHYPFCASLIPA